MRAGGLLAAVLLALLLAVVAAAQPAGPPKHVLKPPGTSQPAARSEVPLDTAAVAPPPVPADALDRFRSDPDYQYERVGAAGPTLWELFWRWVDRTFFEPIARSTSPRFWRIFWPSLAALILAFVLVRVLSAGGAGLFARRDAGAGGEGALLLDAEDIAEVDLDALLRRALAERRHRDAVRLLYLRALQALAAGGLVDWQKDKTNRDYLREVRRADAGLARPFGEVTQLFEWVWYGEAAVDDARFAAVRARFDRFSEALAAAAAPRRGRG
ncbi:MAG TPA: DUF4129 domain-containing protein [Rubricoccaceae bacterium]|nr:DUF4129 domain-containing protein [Rubricoccaceae bacterium]